ncbi:MAG: PAS domain S-box protein [Ignavibacteriae bacterium]|jgi:PAS domain S-box-containing protein|nr:PAS domain S-box protein [Ignavibacteriota bacterium]NOG97184.1 PAS domain S-box protein [Ignavibacteriota bacterium]
MKQLHSLLQKHIQKNLGGIDSVDGDLKKFINEVNSDYVKSEVETRSKENSEAEDCIVVEEKTNLNQVEYLKGLLYDKNAEIKKLKEELQYQSDEKIHSDIILRSLYRINQASYESDTLEKMLNNIREILGSFMDTTNFFIALYDNSTGLLSLPYFIDKNDRFDTFPVGKTLTGYVIENNESVMLYKNQILEMVEKGYIDQVGTLPEVWLGAPMRASDEVNGAVVVQSYISSDAYTIKDLEILKFIAKQVGSLIERKKSDEALKQSEEKYRMLIEAMNEGVVILDDRGFIKFTNNSFLKNLGYTKEELWGCTPSKILASESKNKIAEMMRKRKKGNSASSFEIDLVRKDKTIVKSLVSQRNVYSTLGQFQGSFAIITDVTEIKKAESSFRKYSEELEELNANKDKFFSVIAHDLRSPFISLLGYTEILNEDIDELSPDETKLFASNIHESSQNLFSLLENLLEWSRIQSGKIKFSPVNINLQKLVVETIGLFSENAQRKNIFLNLVDSPLTEVFADLNMIESVLRNLVSNAIKFTNEGGTIKILYTEENGFCKISIEDNGCGIPEESIDKIFSIGDHISTNGTNDEKGTGLGLILCKEFVQKNGGTIWVESKVDVGSKFIFTIPLNN